MVSEKRLRKLTVPEYRNEYLKSSVTAWVVHQLRALREQRRWTQSDLAEKSGTTQSAIARYESEQYGNWNANTLFDLAEAFDVALEIKFVSWPEFMRSTADTSKETMFVAPFSPSHFKVGQTAYQRFSIGEELNKPKPAASLAPKIYEQKMTSSLALQ